MHRFVQASFPDALLLREFAEKKQYLVPKATASASAIIGVMESNASEHGFCSVSRFVGVSCCVIDVDGFP